MKRQPKPRKKAKLPALSVTRVKSILWEKKKKLFKSYNDTKLKKEARRILDTFDDKSDWTELKVLRRVKTGKRKETYYAKVKRWIWSEYSNSFTGKRDKQFIALAKATYDECVSRKCGKKDVLTTFKAIWKEMKGEADRMPPSFQVPQEYFELGNLNLAEIPNYLTVVSELTPYGEFKVKDYASKGKSFSYTKHFKGWVDWCNEVHSSMYGIRKTDDVFIFFVFGNPYFNKDLNRFEVELFSCEADGSPNDFGFVPGDAISPTEVEEPEKKKISPRKKAKKEAEKQAKQIAKEKEVLKTFYSFEFLQKDKKAVTDKIKQLIKPLSKESERLELQLRKTKDPKKRKMIQSMQNGVLRQWEPLERLIIKVMQAKDITDPNLKKAAEMVGYAPLTDTFIRVASPDSLKKAEQIRKEAFETRKKTIKTNIKKNVEKTQKAPAKKKKKTAAKPKRKTTKRKKK
mgnify:CR=1 FL=1